jgi:arginine deiminase
MLETELKEATAKIADYEQELAAEAEGAAAEAKSNESTLAAAWADEKQTLKRKLKDALRKLNDADQVLQRCVRENTDYCQEADTLALREAEATLEAKYMAEELEKMVGCCCC